MIRAWRQGVPLALLSTFWQEAFPLEYKQEAVFLWKGCCQLNPFLFFPFLFLVPISQPLQNSLLLDSARESR